MSCSRACRTVTLRSTKPSARSTKMPTSFLCPAADGPPLPAPASPASTMTSSALTPEPSSWRLQRMHGPGFGMPWRSSRGGAGTGAGVGPATDHGDEVGVVRAVDLVVVGQRAGVAALGRNRRTGRRPGRTSAATGRSAPRRARASPRRGRCCPRPSRRSGSRRTRSARTAASLTSSSLRGLGFGEVPVVGRPDEVAVGPRLGRSPRSAGSASRPGRPRGSPRAGRRPAPTPAIGPSGTSPPAHGVMVQSGFGSGQYDGRSTCASAAMEGRSTVRSETTTIRTTRRMRTPSGATVGSRTSYSAGRYASSRPAPQWEPPSACPGSPGPVRSAGR